MKYRKDIDGLRCFAVLSVLLYHIQNQLLPGGFTGVDVFFVISGFLITRLLKSDIEQKNFCISRFYARRIRRIFPALFTVLFCTLIVAVIALEPKSFGRFTEDFRYAASQLSNFKFAQQVGYFDVGNELSLLLHTWSLGVEEQFYLIWPVLLFLSYRFLGRKSSYILALIALFSFFISDYSSQESPQNAFYLLHSRAWELSIGGIVAFLIDTQNQSKLLNNILALLGSMLLFWGFFGLDNTMTFPGRNALFPVLGTALLIYSGRQKTYASLILETPFCVFIGKISYSLYLWHWPVIVFYKIAYGEKISLVGGCIIFSVSFVLATVSYFFVEQPFRSKTAFVHTHDFKKSTPLLVCLTIFALLVCFVFSYRFEQTGQPTTLTIDICGVKSPSDFKNEAIAVYWTTGRLGFNQKQSVQRPYSENKNTRTGLYHFVFTLPPLHNLNSIRIDPLGGEGVVDITGVQLQGGLFGITRTFKDLSFLLEPGTLVSDDVVFAFDQNKLRVQSQSHDPYFVLFPKIPTLFDTEIALFFIITVCLLIFLAIRSSMLVPNYQSTILSGFAMVFFAILVSYRAQYSKNSSWRFIESGTSEYWRQAETRSDLDKYNTNKNTQVILWGDSHVENYSESVSHWAKARNLGFRLDCVPACPPIAVNKQDFANINDIAVWNYRACFKKNEKTLTAIEKDHKIEYVFFAMRYEFYLNYPYMLFVPAKIGKNSLSRQDYFRQSFRDTIQRLKLAGKKIVLLGQVPLLKENPVQCMKRDRTILASILKVKTKPTCDIDNNFSDSTLKSGRIMFEHAAAGDDSIFFFRPKEYITSIYGDKGALKYHDDNHLNVYGADLLIKPFMTELSSFGTPVQ